MNDYSYGDEEEESELNCSECDEELGDDNICYNEECPEYGEEQIGDHMTDHQERMAERKQMGIE